MGVLNWVTKLLPLVLSGITAVEGIFTKGSDKKTAVVGSAMSIISILESTGVVTEAQVAAAPEAVGELNDAVVKFLNTFNLLSAPTSTTPTVTTSK